MIGGGRRSSPSSPTPSSSRRHRTSSGRSPGVLAAEPGARHQQRANEEDGEAAAPPRAATARPSPFLFGDRQRQLRATRKVRHRFGVLGNRQIRPGRARPRGARPRDAAPLDHRQRGRLFAVDHLFVGVEQDDVLLFQLAGPGLGPRRGGARGRRGRLTDRRDAVARRQLGQPALELGLTDRSKRRPQHPFDVAQHLVGALVALAGLLAHRARHDRGDLGRQIGRGLLGRPKVPFLNPQQRLEVARPLERARARDHEIEHRPHRKQIGALIDRLAHRLLGRHEGDLPFDHAGAGVLALVHRLGDAEVGQLHLALIGQQDVVRADVAVNDPERRLPFGLGVRIGERAADLGRDVQRELARQPHAGGRRPVEDAPEIPAVDQLERQEVTAGADAEIQHLRDVAVRQAHRDVRLVDEHVAELRIGVDGAVDPLQDDRLGEPLAAELGGEEDLRHPAVGDASDDLVPTVLRHSERTNLPFPPAVCPPGLTPSLDRRALALELARRPTRAARLAVSVPKRRSGRLRSICRARPGDH